MRVRRSDRVVHLWYGSETKKIARTAVVGCGCGCSRNQGRGRWMIWRGRLCRTGEQRRVDDGQVI